MASHGIFHTETEIDFLLNEQVLCLAKAYGREKQVAWVKVSKEKCLELQAE